MTQMFNLFFNDYISPYQQNNVYDNNQYENIYNYCFKLKNSIHFMIQEIPSIYTNSTFSQFNKTPQSWNNIILYNDIVKILKHINDYFDPFNSLSFSNFNEGDNDGENQEGMLYKTFLKQIDKELFGLYEFLNKFPILSHTVKDKKQFYNFLDMNTTTLLFQYCWFLVINTFINIVQNKNIILEINSNKSDDINELHEIDFINIDSDTLYPVYFKKDVANLIYLFINNFKNINDITDLSYKNIIDKVNIMRQKEKKNLATKFLGKLNREELKIENELKNLKLGNWSENIHFFRYNKAHEENARKLLDQYIDYDDLDELTPDYINNGNDDDEYNPDNYSYDINDNGYNDDEYDDNEYDNEDYSNNDNFDS
jgi:hypothetical protein